MKFCQKCGTLLVASKEKRCLVCPKCGWEEKAEEPISYTKPTSEDKIVTIGKKELSIHTLPQVKAECPKCGHGKAYWWMVQTRGIDESATQFFRCIKCGYTWRDYS
jgi:DNA-directed RNA polymerase subunit M